MLLGHLVPYLPARVRGLWLEHVGIASRAFDEQYIRVGILELEQRERAAQGGVCTLAEWKNLDIDMRQAIELLKAVKLPRHLCRTAKRTIENCLIYDERQLRRRVATVDVVGLPLFPRF